MGDGQIGGQKEHLLGGLESPWTLRRYSNAKDSNPFNT